MNTAIFAFRKEFIQPFYWILRPTFHLRTHKIMTFIMYDTSSIRQKIYPETNGQPLPKKIYTPIQAKPNVVLTVSVQPENVIAGDTTMGMSLSSAAATSAGQWFAA